MHLLVDGVGSVVVQLYSACFFIIDAMYFPQIPALSLPFAIDHIQRHASCTCDQFI